MGERTAARMVETKVDQLRRSFQYFFVCASRAISSLAMSDLSSQQSPFVSRGTSWSAPYGQPLLFLRNASMVIVGLYRVLRAHRLLDIPLDAIARNAWVSSFVRHVRFAQLCATILCRSFCLCTTRAYRRSELAAGHAPEVDEGSILAG